VKDAVIVPSIEDDIDYNDDTYLLNELESYYQERYKRKKIPLSMEDVMVLLSDNNNS